MTEMVSQRLVYQRLRNRIIETLSGLTEPEADVRLFGFASYFNSAFDFLEADDVRANFALTDQERSAVLAVTNILEQACDATPDDMASNDFLSSEWPGCVAAVSSQALAILLQRGRLSETEEEC